MASKNLTVRKGRCINFGNCPKADSKEVIEINLGDDFVCPNDCGPLIPVEDKNWWDEWGKTTAIIVAVVLILGGGGFGVYKLITKPTVTVTVSISPENPSVEIGKTVNLTTKVVPDNKKIKWFWTSNDENRATVNKNGVVSGVAAGNVSITVADEKNTKLTASVTITVVQPEKEPEPTTKPKTKTTSPPPPLGTYSFGKYVGKFSNGIPDGQGTMYYNCRVQIAKHGRTVYYAEKGDTFVGTWGNGDIVNGNLYDANNNLKAAILAGKRPNPYNLSNDKCE